jgi:glycosyl transferase family 9 (putative heptosyltransferase)
VRRLLIRPGAIGDCILSLPSLEAARADYTEVWAPRAVLPLIRFAKRTRAIADTGLDLVGVVEDARVAALEAFDSIYSWYGTNRPEFRDAVRHLPFTFFPALPPPSVGIPRIPVPAVPIENFVVIHPFASSPKKTWPLENFRAVAANLDLPVKWCAGPQERLDDAVRIDDLYELGCWLAAARVYIGNDSGIAHLAAAVGVPVVAIFLSTDPCVWAPRGDHVAVLRSPAVEEVCSSARTLVASSSARTPRIRMSTP